jgi:hypothetical protein
MLNLQCADKGAYAEVLLVVAACSSLAEDSGEVSGTLKRQGLVDTWSNGTSWIDVDWFSSNPSCTVVEEGEAVSSRPDDACPHASLSIITIKIASSKI